MEYKRKVRWYKEHESLMFDSDESLMKLAVEASDPFQFIAKCKNSLVGDYHHVPVTQDASASAYQIMSYLLLNKEMARLTNLLPFITADNQSQIQDVYACLLKELQHFLLRKLDAELYTIILSKLTRKLIKGLFMPLIYGKTVLSMAQDIRFHYGSILSNKDCFLLACYWCTK